MESSEQISMYKILLFPESFGSVWDLSLDLLMGSVTPSGNTDKGNLNINASALIY